MTNNLRDLDRLHLIPEVAIVRRAVGARMNASMTVRTQSYNEPRIVRAAIGKPANVVRLQVGNAVCPYKWGRLAATFAMSNCSRNHVITNITASLENRGARGAFGRCGFRCSKRPFPKGREGSVRRGQIGHAFDNIFDQSQFKNDRITQVAEPIGGRANLVALADHFPLENNASRGDFEKQYAFAVRGMMGDCSVTLLHDHVTDLALAKILEDAVIAPTVAVSVFFAFFTGENDDNGVFGGGSDPAALLAIESGMNISAPAIHPANFKSPSHPTLPVVLQRPVFSCRHFVRVNSCHTGRAA